MSAPPSLLVAGVLLGTVGGAATLTGATVLAAAGTDSAVSSGPLFLTSPGTAVRTADGDLDARGTGGLGISLRLTVRSDEPVFIGVGPAADVDRYLAGAATDTVDDVETWPLRVVTQHHDGWVRPGPPGSQSFWLRQSVGQTTGTITWPVSDGHHRVVVMNADGSPGVHADITPTVRVQHLTGVAVGLLGGGAASLLAAVLVLLRARRRRPAAPAGPPPADPGADVPVAGEHRSDEPAPAR